MNEETTTSLVDTALASGSASALDPEERALQDLVLAVRDDAPSPEPDFRLRMDARVAAGFPARRRLPRIGWPTVMVERPQRAALGIAGSILIAVVVVASVAGGGGGPGAFGGGSASSGSSTAAPAPEIAAPSSESSRSSAGAQTTDTHGVATAPSKAATQDSAGGGVVGGTAVAPEVGPLPPVGNGSVRGGSTRRVERSAALTLAAPKDKLSAVGDQVVAVTDRYRGIVMRSSVTSGTDQSAGGSFDLRIPVRNLGLALRDLSALADVQARTENGDDVTASFVSARTRIEELTAQRKSLLRRLAAATTDAATRSLRVRLSFVNSDLNAQTASLQRLRRRTDLATVSVALVAKQGGTTSGGINRGWHDLRNSLVDAANTALRVLGVAIPIALMVALLWGGNAILTRRRREAALDSRG